MGNQKPQFIKQGWCDFSTRYVRDHGVEARRHEVGHALCKSAVVESSVGPEVLIVIESCVSAKQESTHYIICRRES